MVVPINPQPVPCCIDASDMVSISTGTSYVVPSGMRFVTTGVMRKEFSGLTNHSVEIVANSGVVACPRIINELVTAIPAGLTFGPNTVLQVREASGGGTDMILLGYLGK